MGLPKPLQFSDIESERRSAKLTQVALCRRAKVDPTTYCRWKNGEFEPGSESLRKLHAALGQLIAEASNETA